LVNGAHRTKFVIDDAKLVYDLLPVGGIELGRSAGRKTVNRHHDIDDLPKTPDRERDDHPGRPVAPGSVDEALPEKSLEGRLSCPSADPELLGDLGPQNPGTRRQLTVHDQSSQLLVAGIETSGTVRSRGRICNTVHASS
jgi:hypothetical protein